ncbi:secretory lipase precursor, putative [Candida dubliniensis CD36]|uniref:Lipase n=1 Tax=Candida dubliniensis (strain CD36 / ATCC MYA-646 / CBS 7987 / NCPF 3949 / NRRL Y-17841) TaxID=573826 RepID=B9WKF1_CANDC|nr:secretory lipase precursor, putative [Candida dubliniensis CD36]CAX40803.1 secretory lipase precursor, putative [Candida dubliniensis CD36]
MLFLLFLLAAPIYAGLIFPTKPSKDPFYNAPEGFEKAAVGDILQSRVTPKSITGGFIPLKIQNSWQLLVRSEDSFGNPNVIVTTVMEPFNADPSKVASYQVFEDAAKADCAPSYALQFGSDWSTLATQAEMYLMAPLLDQGYYVVSPDYEGPKSTFTIGKQSGQAVLNSIRATLKSGKITNVKEDAKVVMWGYSGGSLASGWAAALQPDYAPELSGNLLGAALGGFVTNITATAEATDDGIFAGIVANALGGVANEYSEFKEILQNDTDKQSVFDQFDSHCLADGVINYIGTSFLSGDHKIFKSGWDILKNPTISKVVEDNGLVYQKQLVPKIPILIYHGSIDQIVPIVNTKKTYQNWCDAGIASLEFSEDATNGHLTEAIIGAPAALTWIIDRFAGKQTVSGCQHVQRLSNLEYPNIPSSMVDYFKAALDVVLHLGLGPDIQKDQVSAEGIKKLGTIAI